MTWLLTQLVMPQVTRFTLDNYADLLLFLEQHAEQVSSSPASSCCLTSFFPAASLLTCFTFPQFESGESGCVLLTISAVLSRSITKYVLRSDAVESLAGWNL